MTIKKTDGNQRRDCATADRFVSKRICESVCREGARKSFTYAVAEVGRGAAGQPDEELCPAAVGP